MEGFKRFKVGNVISINQYHFLLLQLMNGAFGIIIGIVFYWLNPVGLYLLLSFPVWFAFVYGEYIVFWKRTWSLFAYFNIHFVAAILFGTLFVALSIQIFNREGVFPFQQIDSCSVVGQMKEAIDKNSNLSALIVDFQIYGEMYQGYSCFNNEENEVKFEEKRKPRIFSEDFYPKKCAKRSQQDDSQRERDIFQETKFVNQPDSLDQGNNDKDCQDINPLTFVELQEWMCASEYTTLEELLQPQHCYVGVFDPHGQNILTEQYLKRGGINPEKKFIMVLLGIQMIEIQPNIITLVLSYITFIISLNGFFYFISKSIILCFLQRFQEQVEFNSKLSELVCTIQQESQISPQKLNFFAQSIQNMTNLQKSNLIINNPTNSVEIDSQTPTKTSVAAKTVTTITVSSTRVNQSIEYTYQKERRQVYREKEQNQL